MGLWEITAYLLEGLSWSLRIYVVTIILAMPLSVLVAIGKVSAPKPLKMLLDLYTWAWRGTPLMLQLFFIYFALPSVGIVWDQFLAVTIGFVLNFAAYETEILRAGIQSIDKGQYEAAKALGMNYRQTMQRVILPQIIGRVLPATCSEFIILLKDTSLAAAIGMGEMLRNAKYLVTTYMDVAPFFVAFVIYLLLSSVLVQLFGYLEKRYSVYE